MHIRHKLITMLLSVSLFYGGIESACCYGQTFQSDMLEEMSAKIPLNLSLTCDSTFAVKSGNRDITVRVSDGCVEHIGYTIFQEGIRSGAVNSSIADFVERYWLSLTMPLKRQKSVKQQMLEDRFVFQAGGIETIDEIQQNPAMPFACHSTQNTVTMVWGDANNPVCQISFPVDHELLLGRKMLENDRRLPSEIARIRIRHKPPKDTGSLPSAHPDSLTSLWINQASTYIDCALKSDRYYTLDTDGTTLAPVFDAAYPKESIVNLFTDYDIEQAENLHLSIRHKTFGLNEQVIETTIPAFVAYCMQKGCVPFAGVISVGNDNSGLVDILVIMHNRPLGYNHVLRASVPLTCLSTGEGIAHGRLNAFIPSSNIKNLFKN